MLTQDGINVGIYQRHCQGFKNTKFLNAITSPTCNPPQQAQEPFQLRTALSSKLYCSHLWAQALLSAAPEHLIRSESGPSSRTGAFLDPGGLQQSLSPRLVLPLTPPLTPQHKRSLVSPSCITTNDKKNLREINYQVILKQHYEYGIFNIAKSRDEEVTLKR